MNHIYKTIFDKGTGAIKVVSENASSKGGREKSNKKFSKKIENINSNNVSLNFEYIKNLFIGGVAFGAVILISPLSFAESTKSGGDSKFSESKTLTVVSKQATENSEVENVKELSSVNDETTEIVSSKAPYNNFSDNTFVSKTTEVAPTGSTLFGNETFSSALTNMGLMAVNNVMALSAVNPAPTKDALDPKFTAANGLFVIAGGSPNTAWATDNKNGQNIANGNDYGIAIGSMARGFWASVAMGDTARAGSLYGTAIGPYANIDNNSNYGSVFGYKSKIVTSDNGLAMGYQALVSNALNGIALGSGAQSLHEDGIAIGADSKTVSKNSVSFGNDTLKRTITNIGAGVISKTSTDAINGSQLFDNNTVISKALGGGSTVDANGKITAPSYNVAGTKVDNVGAAVTNIDGRVTNNTQNISNLTQTLSDGAFSVSANGTGAKKVAKDAVIDFSNDDKNLVLSQNGSSFKFNLADQLNLKQGLTIGDSSLTSNGLTINGGPSISKTGINANNTIMTNVANGKLAADSKDAINGSQLFESNTVVSKALGGGSTVGADGKITAPSYSVDSKVVDNVGAAVTNIDGRVTSNTQNISNLTQTLSDGAFSVSANGTGAKKVAKDAVIDFSNEDKNLVVSQDGSNFKFNLADQLNLKQGLTVGDSSITSNGLVIKDGPSITKTGIDANDTIVTNIKDGVGANDAVSKGQLDKGLKDAGLVDADGKMINAVTYDKDGNVTLKGSNGAGSLLTNLANGKVAAGSKDAINGSQLFENNTVISKALGGDSTVDADGNITAPSYKVGDTTVDNVGAAVTNIDGRVTSNTQNISNLTTTLSEGAFSVSANATGAKKVAKDAVIDFSNEDKNLVVSQDGTNFKFNLADQLNLKQGLTVGDSSITSSGLVINSGPSITKSGIDANDTIVTNIKDGVGAKDAVTKGQFDKGLKDAGLVDAEGKMINAVTYDKDGNVTLKGSNGGASLLTNVANGKVAAGSKDAVNGSQLFENNTVVSKALGGGSTVDADGKITAPSYKVGDITVDNVGAAVTNIDGRVTNIDGRVTSNTQSISNLTTTLSEGAFSVSANATGAKKVAKDAVIDFSNDDKNLVVSQDGTNFKFNLADQLNLKQGLTVGDSSITSSGLVIKDGPSITKTGIDAKDTIVTNIKDGVGAKDAVSKGQFDKGLKDAGLIDAEGKMINAVTYDKDGNVTLKGSNGGASLLTNVANGKVAAGSKDAVNGGQLFENNTVVSKALGGGSTVDKDGKITAPSYKVGDIEVDNVGAAVTNIDGRVTTNTQSISNLTTTLSEGAFSVSANGKDAKKVAKDAVIDFSNDDKNLIVSQDGTNFKFNLADQLNLKQGLTVGDSSITSSGLVIKDGPSITKTGIDAKDTIVTNIKDGVGAKDAVSKGQFDKGLKDAGLVDADGKMINAVTYDKDGNVVLKGSNGGASLLTNVANGKVAAGSTDAINGSQLFENNTVVSKALGGGSTVDADGKITAPSYKVGDIEVDNVGAAVTNIDGRVTSNTQNISNLTTTLSEGAFSVSANATGAKKVAKDAVIDFSNDDKNLIVSQDGTNFKFNLADQLNLKQSLTVGDSSITSNGFAIKDGPSITKTGIDAKNTVVSNIKDGVNANDAVSKGQLDKGLKEAGLIGEDGKMINAVTYDQDGNVALKGSKGGASLLTNVANGKVAAGSTDAINGSQLFENNTVVSKALGGGSTVDADGNITAPSYKVGDTTVDNVGAAVTNIDGRVTNIDGRVTSNTQNISNLTQTLSDGAFSISANATGAKKVAKDAVIDFSNEDKNLVVSQDGTNFKFNLADQLNLKQGLTVGNSSITSNGLVIKDGPSITKTGIDANDTIVTNIKDGVGAKDAVTKGQFDKGLKDAGLVDADGKMINAVTYDKDGNVTLKGSNGAGSLLSNLANGKVAAGSKDAINGSQLFENNTVISKALGGDSTVDADGNITAPSYKVGDTTVDNVGAAVTNIDGRVTNIDGRVTSNTQNISNLTQTLSDGAFSISANATGAKKVAKDAVIDFSNEDKNLVVSQDGTNFKFNLADQLNLKQGLTVGNSSITSNGLVIKDGPSITKTGIDANDTIVTNIKDGVGAKDAVTKGQFDKGLKDAGLVDADGKMINAVTYDKDGNVTLKGSNGAGSLLTNIANGKVAAGSKDAVNGSQLFENNTVVSKALGGGSTVDADGKITAPSYKVGDITVDNVGAAVTNIDGRVTSNTQNISNLTTTLSEGAFSVSANGKDAKKVAKNAVIDFSNDDKNLVVSQDGTNFKLNLAQTLKVDSINAGGNILNNQGLTIGNALMTSGGFSIKDGPSITAQGISAGGKTISNVGQAVNGSDAVNKAQMDSEIAKINTAIETGLGGSVQYDKKADGSIDKDNLTLAGGSNGTHLKNVADGTIATGSKDAVNGGQIADIRDNLQGQIDSNTDSIANIQDKIGDIANGKSGLTQQTSPDADITIGKTSGGKTINVSGQEGDRVVTGVAAGKVAAGSTDVINGGQLHQSNSTIAQALGGGSSVDDKGNITAPKYQVGADTHNNVGSAITALDQANQGLDHRVTQLGDRLEESFRTTNNRIDRLENKSKAAIASAIAIASLPQPTEKGYAMLSAGTGVWEGEYGISVGASGITEDKKIFDKSVNYIWKFAGTTDSRGSFGGGAAMGIQWK